VGHELDLDLGGFAQPVGTPGSVAVTITCHLVAAELGLPGMSDITVSASALNPLDTFRERANR
jgi:trimethylamine:corrinoid methyltransferase-like protein